jgi:hypothetical protein
MGKIGKTFTIDIDIYNWLEQHARKENRKVSFVVNQALREIKRSLQTWKCSVCGMYNDNESTSCYFLKDGIFCEGKPPKT